jgi:hypothetical protein
LIPKTQTISGGGAHHPSLPFLETLIPCSLTNTKAFQLRPHIEIAASDLHISKAFALLQEILLFGHEKPCNYNCFAAQTRSSFFSL